MSELRDGWRRLTDGETREAWDRFYGRFSFRPSIHSQNWPSIVEPIPSATWDISSAFEDPDPLMAGTNSGVNTQVLEILRRCVPTSLLVLDWQHVCYEFQIHHPSAGNAPESWPIPVIPNGDYSIFLAPDLESGLFGHPWESSVCVFGRSLLQAVEFAAPAHFGRLLRRSPSA